MAREYAPIRLDIWTDDDWRALTPRAQWLYFYLLTSPTLSYCGVADWRPARIAAAADGLTAADIRLAGAELIDRLFIVVDEASEEVLVRSFIKHDGLLRNPKTSVSMANAFGSVASKTLRGVVVHQLNRLHSSQPDLKAWSVERVTAILGRQSVNPADLQEDSGVGHPEDYPVGLGEDLPQGLPEGYPVGLGDSHPEDLGERSLPAPAPAPYSSSNSGYVTRERHQATAHDPDAPPPRTCPEHPDGTTRACGACGLARKTRDAWDAEQTRLDAERHRAERQAQADAERAEIDNCDLCDDRGYVGVRVCDHDPDAAERNRRGAALVREALGAKGGAA